MKKETDPVLLTFSKKNYDVNEILKEVAKSGVKKTDYICEAVRFYYKSRDEPSSKIVDKEHFEKLFLDCMKKYCKCDGTSNNLKSGFDFSALSKRDLEDD